jgi:hypothetical protein
MTGRIREIVFDEGVDASGTVIEAASVDYVDGKFDPKLETFEDGIWLDNTSGLPTLDPWRAGVIAYDTVTGSAAISTTFTDKWLKVGRESHALAINTAVTTIDNGKAVYLSTASSSLPVATLANCTDDSIGWKSIGICSVSAGITTGNSGLITTSGLVTGLNTNAFTEGDLLYLDTASGSLTKTLPSYLYRHILVGIVVVKSATVGQIYVSVKDLTDEFAKAGYHVVDPHGWTEYDNTYMTRGWNTGTRAFTLTQVGTSTPYYCKGKLKYLTGNKTITLLNVSGPHFIGLNCTTELLEDLGGTLPVSQGVSTHILVEFAYVDASGLILFYANERHTTKFPKRVWIYNHLYLSTQYKTGITPTMVSIDGNGTSIDHARFTTTAGSIQDEDIEIAIAKKDAIDQAYLYYYNGTTWTWVNGNNGTGVINTGSGRAAYNNIASGLAECNSGYHVLSHVFASNDGTVIVIIGQAQYNTANQAKLAASSEISTIITAGLPMPEFRAICTFINLTATTYSNAVKSAIVSVDTGIPFIDWRKTALNPVAGTSASNHNSLTSLQGGQAGEYYHLTAADYGNIVAKIFPGGAASDAGSKFIYPTKTSSSGLTPTIGTGYYNSTSKKLEIADGSSFKEVGGGLAVTVLDAPALTGVNLESGKHYIVTGLTGDTTLNLPQMALGSSIRIGVFNNLASGYRVTLAAYAGDAIGYDSTTTHTSAKIVYADDWTEVSARTTYWMAECSASPLNGTFSGAFTVTGPFTPSAGIVGKTDGVAVTPGNVGQIYSVAWGSDVTLTNQGTANEATGTAWLLPKGIWIVTVKAQFSASITPSGNIQDTTYAVELKTGSGAGGSRVIWDEVPTANVNPIIQTGPAFVNNSVDTYYHPSLVRQGGGTGTELAFGSQLILSAIRIA